MHSSGRDFMTIAEVADHLRKHPRTIRRQIHAGELRAYRIGGSFLVSYADLVGYLRRRLTRGRKPQ
jgi:excisionase family DNA binding protein